MKIAILDETQIYENLNQKENRFFPEYYAFYSSWFGGIVKNPHLMLVPIDDHLVHRGDGVFEGMKAIGQKIYLFDEHLHRLSLSANAISLKLPYKLEEIKHIIQETVRVANQPETSIRVYLSRGPGNFTANPYDSIGEQFYVAVVKLHTPSEEQYKKGAMIGISSVPGKDSWMAKVKSCNYLPNVMMKKEAVDRGIDFAIGIDERGFIAEGPTENIMIVDANGVLVYPVLDYILKGTTMIRACELAQKNGIKVESRPISRDELKSAREVMMCGTSLDVIAVTQFEDHKIGEGKPGPIAKKLRELVLRDMGK